MSKKTDNDVKLANGAAKIHKARKEADKAKAAKPKPAPAEKDNRKLQVYEPVPECTRPIEDILRDRVTILDGHIGLKLSDATTIEENLAILDWATSLSNHAGFMIGDVLLAGEKNAEYGSKYDRALHQTGRKYSTLQSYKSVAKAVPPKKRVAALSFSHYERVQGLLTEPKVMDLLEKVGKECSAGRTISKADLRIKALAVAPRKKKAPKKATSGKGKKKPKPVEIPFEPNPEQQAKMDEAEEAAATLAGLLKADGELLAKGGVFSLVATCDTKEKQRWLDIFYPLHMFWSNLERVTGY